MSDIDLGAMFEASPNAYLLVTPDLHMAGMNQAYLDIARRERAELIGQPVFGAFDGGPGEDGSENARQLRASYEKVLATGERNDLALLHYPIPVRQADGETAFEDHYWTVTHTPIHGDKGVAYILHHAIDVTELEKLHRRAAPAPSDPNALDAILGGDVLNRAARVQKDNRRLEGERNRLAEMFMQAPGFVAVLSGPDHVFQMHNAAYGQLIGHRDITGKPVREALPELVGQGYYEFLDGVLATGEAHEGRASRIQLQRMPDAPLEDVYLNFVYQPIRDDDGKVIGIFVQGHDVTDSVVSSQRQKLMIDELNHRVKNTLSTVQSIAMQTARSHQNPATFAEGFQARLMALSHTHDLLTRSHWEGADLRDILQHETAAHDEHRVVLNGPPVPLDPAAALSLGMIFHELATNAAKYGALSAAEGRVFIDWSIANQADPRLTVIWQEHGGPAVAAPERRGFGSRLIERNARHDLAGEAKLSYATDGFSAEISFPLTQGRLS